MKKLMGLLLGIFVFAGIGMAAAQEMSGTTPPPKVLFIYREFLKPGKSGMTHEKSESAFVQALTKAKSNSHYFAADSLSGRPRSLFLFGYDSFESWEKDFMSMQKDPALAAALDRAAVADGELLSDMDAAVLTYDEEQSLRPDVDIAHMRYFEISTYEVKPGHRQDWADLVKLVKAAYDKIPTAHWVMFEEAYGPLPSATYLVISPIKSLSEVDQEFAQDKDFVAAMGEDGMKKLHDLEAAAVESSGSALFMFNPKMSYPQEEWIKADPDFWKPKMMKPMMPMKKPAEKPAMQ